MALKKTQKSLKRWTKQEWGYVTKKDEKKTVTQKAEGSQENLKDQK